MRREKRGFTLLEILLVIAAIGVLVAIILIAINPNRQLGQARNSVRQSESNSIAKAIEQYAIDNGGAYPGGITGTYQDICPVGVSSNCVNLSTLVPNYIAGIPLDPSGGNYQVAINPSNGKVSLRAPNTETGNNIAVNPFTPTITFAKSVGGISNGYGTGISSLGDGSIIITGSFYGPEIFGEGNIVIVKYSANGTLVWAKKVGGAGYADPYGISSLADGSSIITGEFSDTVIFGEGESNETSLVSAGDRDMFIAKYNVNGSLAWAKKAGGTGDTYPSVYGYRISSLADGSSVVTGDLYDTVIFGEGESNQTSLTAVIGYDMFIAKYNLNGTLAWAKKVETSGYASAFGISSLVDGSSIITGSFNNTVIFGEGENNETSLTSSNADSTFITKYNANGTLAWAKKVVGIYNVYAYGISSLADESSIITGRFSGAVIFGEGENNETSLTSNGYSNIFIAKYNLNGDLVWAKKAGGIGYASTSGISSLADGSSIITGSFNNTVIFGEGESNETSLNSSNYIIFIAKYNANGSLAWAKKGAEAEGEYSSNGVNAISSYADGDIVITGTFCGENTFGKNNPGETLLSSLGYSDFFVAKYNMNGELTTPNTINPNNPTFSCEITDG